METPFEDADEQAREVVGEQAHEIPEAGGKQPSAVPFEADEADAAEQVRDAGYDDEDYR